MPLSVHARNRFNRRPIDPTIENAQAARGDGGAVGVMDLAIVLQTDVYEPFRRVGRCRNEVFGPSRKKRPRDDEGDNADNAPHSPPPACLS